MEEKREVEHEDVYILVDKINEGDREAFMTLTSLYQKKVFLLAFSFFRNKEDALDIVQETFLRFYEKVKMFRRGKNFQNWLLQIAKNLCIDYYRKNYSKDKEWVRNKPIDEMNLPIQNSYDPLVSSDLKEIISTCLTKLAEKQRMIFVMRHYNQLKYREIAQILDISLGTAKSLHFKAVQNLKGLMAPYLGRQL
ncbi:MAG: sigma-70 family RNA polymerase sigma factor [Candidatus Aminicenantes bacterium]|nr:sigma-70 family RNA polymerase sigma factor [Candidatus Aminicenantes bacterium]